MKCFVCGLDARSVKITQMQVIAEGGLTTMTVCEHCKDLVSKGNHPLNQNVSEDQEVDRPGFIKPSDPERPSVRPQ